MTGDIYPYASFTFSLVATVLYLDNLVAVGHWYARYPDRRAARSAIIALVLFITSAGLMMSALSLMFGPSELQYGTVASISVVRGTLLVGAIILWLDRHRPVY